MLWVSLEVFIFISYVSSLPTVSVSFISAVMEYLKQLKGSRIHVCSRFHRVLPLALSFWGCAWLWDLMEGTSLPDSSQETEKGEYKKGLEKDRTPKLASQGLSPSKDPASHLLSLVKSIIILLMNYQ